MNILRIFNTNTRKIYLLLVIFSFFCVLLYFTVGVSANQASADVEAQCAGQASGSAFCAGYTGTTENPVVKIIKAATDLLALIAGFLAVVYVLYGGFSYITAAGDSGKISSAKNNIIYALVGLVVVIVARTLIQYVLGKIN